MTKVLIASDGHKHIMSPSQACESICDGLTKVYPDIQISLLPMADGGDGTIDALVHAHQGEIAFVHVHDPLLRPREAKLGLYHDTHGIFTGVIEIAEAAGSALLRPHERQTMIASSYGVGELLLHAQNKGCNKIIVGLGGSIVSDMGMGMAQALGIRFFDCHEKELDPIGARGFNALSLDSVSNFCFPSDENTLSGIDIVAASDANINLLGKDGQARVFGPQKGANLSEIEYLETGFTNVADVIRSLTGRNVDVAYAGAAGGLGAGLLGFLGATIKPGAALIAELVGLDKSIVQNDYIITGEGHHDSTTYFEKTPYYVSKRSQFFSKPVIGVVGTIDEESSYDCYDMLISCDTHFSEINKQFDHIKDKLKQKSMSIDLNQLH